MRRLTILLALTSMAVALESGVAVANSATFTVRGTIAAASPSRDSWYLRDATRRVVGTAAFFCLQPNSKCAWNFRFESGSFDIKVPRRETLSRVGLTAEIVDAAGDLAHETGRVHIYFLTPKVATFTFHLKDSERS